MYIRFLLIAMAVILSQPSSLAGMIIDDNRIEHLIAPSIGRGYNLNRNALLSQCFSKVKATEPVFDIVFDIDTIHASYLENLQIENIPWIEKKHIREFLTEHMSSVSKNPKSEYILARLIVSNYYHSLSEANSEVDPNILLLLNDGKFIDFFDTCGFYYLRSINHYSTYMVLFEFESENENSLEVAENSIKHLLFNKLDNIDPNEHRYVNKIKNIYVRSHGLQKTKDTEDVIPFTVEKIRNAFKTAYNMINVDGIGKISKIEVTPWINNPIVNSALINHSDNPNYFKRKLNIEANSEILTRIEAIYRQRNEALDFMQECKAELIKIGTRTAFAKRSNNDKTFNIPEVKFRHHLYPSSNQYDIQFNKFLNEINSSIKLLSSNEEDWHNNTASVCVEIISKNIGDVYGPKIPECQAIISKQINLKSAISDYCMPEMTD